MALILFAVGEELLFQHELIGLVDVVIDAAVALHLGNDGSQHIVGLLRTLTKVDVVAVIVALTQIDGLRGEQRLHTDEVTQIVDHLAALGHGQRQVARVVLNGALHGIEVDGRRGREIAVFRIEAGEHILHLVIAVGAAVARSKEARQVCELGHAHAD